MSLEIEEDYALQVRSWRVQRVGWCAMALVVAAALAGLLGPGPLLEREVESRSGLQLRYDPFVRYEAPASMQVTLRSQQDGRAEFWIEGGWLAGVHLETIVPEPERVVVRDERMHVSLATHGAGELVHATLHFEADTWGPLKGAIGEPGDPGVSIDQFAYP